MNKITKKERRKRLVVHNKSQNSHIMYSFPVSTCDGYRELVRFSDGETALMYMYVYDSDKELAHEREKNRVEM